MKRLALAVLFVAAAWLISAPAPKEQAGPLPDGGYLLPVGWRILPAGRQVPLDTLPMAAVPAPGGRHLLVLNGGYRPPSISAIDLETLRESSRVRVADGWQGLAVNGDRVYAGGGSRSSVLEFTWADGAVRPARTFEIKAEGRSFVGDVITTGRSLWAANLYNDSLARIDLDSGAVAQFKTGRRPYRLSFHPDGKTVLVTCWTDNSIVRHSLANGEIVSTTAAGAHAGHMLWDGSKRLFVAAANTNYVEVRTPALELIEKINVSLTPRQPVGITPSGLALNAGGTRLFVVCSNANAVAVVDVSKPRSRVLGFIPAGWYPTAAEVLRDGRLVVLNGRGARSYANPNGPTPYRRAVPQSQGTPEPEYVGRLQTGSASVIEPFNEKDLAGYTKTAMANMPYRDRLLENAGPPKGNPIPASPGGSSPIRHVVYIIKENRTYDQVFGDIGKGNSDPSLELFGEKTTPNQHKLAREFALLDNFYVSADVSADGHNWSMSAIAPDFVEKVWPNGYAHRGTHTYLFGIEPAAAPPNGFIWTRVREAGRSMRNYGYLGVNIPAAPREGVQLSEVRDPILKPVTDLRYRAYELAYPDVDRAKEFLRELAEYERKGEWPDFILMRLGNNHTVGTTPGGLTPFSHVADNDYALGLVVEGISKSRFWKETAIFVLEDDAQNGPDHVDSHRSPALVISPYVRRAIVDSSMYNTTSMLRTMELILGAKPMTTFDAGARPMWASFTSAADTRPFTAESPRTPLTDRNPQRSATAARSAKLDFSEADLNDDDEMNEILWRAIRGTSPPAPVRSYFSR